MTGWPAPPWPPTITHGHQIDGTNTGPLGAGLAYADLTPSGPVTTSSDGQIIEGLDVLGAVRIRHNDVTIRNCRIDGGGSALYCVDFASRTPVTGTLVEWCELIGAASAGIVHYSPYTLRRCNIHAQLADAIKAGSNCLVEECYLHDPAPAAGAHVDGCQIVTAPDGPVTIRRCRIEGNWRNQTSAILAQSATGPIAGLTVEDNLLGGGAYSLYTIDSGYRFGFTSPPEIHGNYFVQESAQFGARQSTVACHESGNFDVPLLGGDHSSPWPVDLTGLRARD